MRRGIVATAVGTLVMTGCASAPLPEETDMTDALDVTSSAFDEGGAIPSRYTCDGDDVSPPIAWSGAPDGAAAFALIVDDPDARGWIHWLVADIPADRQDLDEGASGSSAATEGRNDFGRTGHGGPCPPSGTHRYAFEVFALSQPLGLASGFSADELRAAMEGKVLATGRLNGTYARGGGS
jgi:Raf kinase inhibitor-like YbhB/YbcL family protein